jgi:hypothetical protein
MSGAHTDSRFMRTFQRGHKQWCGTYGTDYFSAMPMLPACEFRRSARCRDGPTAIAWRVAFEDPQEHEAGFDCSLVASIREPTSLATKCSRDDGGLGRAGRQTDRRIRGSFLRARRAAPAVASLKRWRGMLIIAKRRRCSARVSKSASTKISTVSSLA